MFSRPLSPTGRHSLRSCPPSWIRTNDRSLKRRLLYQLSYGRIFGVPSNRTVPRNVTTKSPLRNDFPITFFAQVEFAYNIFLAGWAEQKSSELLELDIAEITRWFDRHVPGERLERSRPV